MGIPTTRRSLQPLWGSFGGGGSIAECREPWPDRRRAPKGLSNGILASQSPTYGGIRSSETYLEASYVYQLRPWWQVQPDFQYVFRPGGGVENPNRPGTRVGDELVLGLRTNLLF